MMLSSSFAADILAQKTFSKRRRNEIWLISKFMSILIAENSIHCI